MRKEMLNKNRRFDYILETLHSNLHEGKWVKGDRLPTLQVLAKNFDVSISTIREALRVLQDQGLVSIEQGRGIFVIEEFKNFKKSDKNDFNIIDLMHLNEARLILEPALAENAARQAIISEKIGRASCREREESSDVCSSDLPYVKRYEFYKIKD